MVSNRQSWSIIVFCFNEAGTIEKVVTAVKAVLDEMAPDMHEIVIVDDGSQDGSTEKIRDLEKTIPNIKAVFHPVNLGIGSTLRNGYAHAKNQNVCAVPADGQFDVRELLPYRTLEERTFISFYRHEKTTYSMFRNGLSYINKKLNQMAIGLHLRDVNWIKIYNNEALQMLDLHLQSSLVESEICSKLVAQGNKVIEVQSTYLPRTYGMSKGASVHTVFQAAKETWKLIATLCVYNRR